MKLLTFAIAPVAALALAACGETGESADINMSADAVAPGAGTGGAEGPAEVAGRDLGTPGSPTPEATVPVGEQPQPTPTAQ